ncbi:MAG: M23 family metallopeptidase [Pseudoxanthomonas sp.]
MTPTPSNASGTGTSATRLRRWLLRLTLLAALGLIGAWAWHQPFLTTPRAMWSLYRQPAPLSLPVPVQGVRARQVADTFGAPRGADRSHAGVDIFAKRGTPVVSATAGVVASIRDGGLGGRQVWIVGPAGERHYYAHLQDWRPGLEQGHIVTVGTVLGYVGDSGNAKGTPPHLHYGIYGKDGAYDPLPLLRAPR